MMKGLNIEGMRKHPSLIPLFVFVGFGCIAAVGYTLRLAARGPEVTWNRHSNPEPWNDYSKKQYKLYKASDSDDAEKGSLAPKF